jgi:translation initiation factor IF-2
MEKEAREAKERTEARRALKGKHVEVKVKKEPKQIFIPSAVSVGRLAKILGLKMCE